MKITRAGTPFERKAALVDVDEAVLLADLIGLLGRGQHALGAFGPALDIALDALPKPPSTTD